MSKKMITVEVDTVSPYDFSHTTLNDVRVRIDDLIALHGADARLNWNANFYYSYDDTPSPRFEVMVTRPETDQEVEARELDEAVQRNLQEARDREEYERLQAKFNRK